MTGKTGHRKGGNAKMRKPSLAQKDVLNPEEAIEYFGFSRRKFNRFLKDGKCKKYTALYGRRRLILRSEFEKYLEENPEVKEGLLNGGKSKVTA